MKSLRYKIGFGYFVLVALIILLSILAAFNFFRLSNSITSILEKNTPVAVAVQNMLIALDDQTADHILMLIGDTDLAYASYEKNRDRFLSWYQKVVEYGPSREEMAIMDSVIIDYRSYIASSSAFYRLCKENNPLARPFHVESIVPMEIRLRRLCRRVIERNQILATNTTQMAKEITDAGLIVMAAAAGIAIFFAFYA
ncbi:hypothetical protein JXO59_04780, partial [candidate division KSB1 bacterium]|nr:hypothetical protein [candidate division KSB1 bacterium]